MPGSLLAILAAIGLAAAFQSFSELRVGTEHLVQVPTPSSWTELKAQFYFPDFSALYDPQVYIVALTIAVVASLETLLCVEATDKMDPRKGRTPMNRELKAQGLGNMFAGLLGGLPITQVIVRSSANINAGARSKRSAIFHGMFLLVFVALFPGLLNMIPRAAMASILILIGFKLASPKSIKNILKSGWPQAVPYVVVVTVMLLTDLLMGVGAGLIVGFMIILYRNYKIAHFVDPNENDGEVVTLRLSEHTTFLNKASILKTFDEIEAGKKVVIDLRNAREIDYDINEAITDFKASEKERNISVEILGEEKLMQTMTGGH